MKLANLLEQHRKFSPTPGALADAFGDGFLVHHNSIYGRIRTGVVKNGFQFSTKQNDAYRALPLSQLDWILKQKVIPYIDNVTVLAEIETKIPKQTVWNDIVDNLKGNSVFHEACHGMARSFVGGFADRLVEESKLEKTQAKILVALLEESFANTCELLSILDAGDQVHRLFLELNSYVYMLDDRVHLANASREIGPTQLAKFILLCYLHANFLRELGDRDFDRILKLVLREPGSQPDAKLRKALRSLSRIAFQLNPRFREVTTRFYLRLQGLAHEKGLAWDFLKGIESSQSAQIFLESAGRMVGGNAPGSTVTYEE